MMKYEFLVAGIHMIFLVPEMLDVPDNFQPFLIPTIPYEATSDSTPEMVLEVTIQSSDHAADPFLDQPQKKKDREGPPYYQMRMTRESFRSFASCGHWLNYLKFGEMLLPYKRVILHASAILYDGKAYLFVAPSGGGKSTQAEIWRRCYGSEILNGDKVILNLSEEEITVYGSPVAGSSGIYQNRSAPLGAIFVIKKAAFNRLFPIQGFHRLLVLYNAAVKSVKDDKINECLLDELREISDKIPLYHYYCTNGRSAARDLHNELFGD
ncbi:MAG: hypothetical protein MJ097_01610 [Dorea sp.]|nr:hypothetical protein [Dorea sp.]